MLSYSQYTTDNQSFPNADNNSNKKNDSDHNSNSNNYNYNGIATYFKLYLKELEQNKLIKPDSACHSLMHPPRKFRST